jgi:hypothetical protein
MKKKITIGYCAKRTFNLSNYENIVPVHTVTEEIELEHGEEYTGEQYRADFARLKRLIRDEMAEDAMRVKNRNMGYPSERQINEILSLCKTQKLDVDEVVNTEGYPSLGSLTAKAATIIIHNLKTHVLK